MLVVKPILMINLSSLFLRTFSVMEPIAARCDNSLGPNMTDHDALYSKLKYVMATSRSRRRPLTNAPAVAKKVSVRVRTSARRVPSTHWIFLSDMSPTVFEKFAAIEVGVIEVTWNFL